MFDAIAQAVIDTPILLAGIPVTLRRLDQIHPAISGNKFFKLKYNFEYAKQHGYSKLLTFGGAYSNHIAATAYAAQYFGFQSVGVIRGEELNNKALNPTLQTARDFGMQLHFISREDYRHKDTPQMREVIFNQFPEHYIIPEGGTNRLAIQGCQEILSAADAKFDLICCAVGTGGTITGLIEASQQHQNILGFSALKGNFLTQDVAALTSKRNWRIIDDYCCGGYAKTTAELLAFMHRFEQESGIPLEQVYTAKMLMGLEDLLQKQMISAQQRILVMHTGGLQGRYIN